LNKKKLSQLAYIVNLVFPNYYSNSKPVISVIFDGNHKKLPRQSLERHKPLMV